MKVIPVHYKTPMEHFQLEDEKEKIRKKEAGLTKKEKRLRRERRANNTGFRELEASKSKMGNAIQIRNENDQLPITISEARYQELMKKSEAFEKTDSI